MASDEHPGRIDPFFAFKEEELPDQRPFPLAGVSLQTLDKVVAKDLVDAFGSDGYRKLLLKFGDQFTDVLHQLSQSSIARDLLGIRTNLRIIESMSVKIGAVELAGRSLAASRMTDTEILKKIAGVIPALSREFRKFHDQGFRYSKGERIL